MKFKYTRYLDEFMTTPKLLQFIVRDADDIAKVFGKEITITRVTEKVAGESGVHSYNRAVDARDEHMGNFTFTEDEREAIVRYINAKYPRKDGFKTCIWHDFNSGPHHFHFQVPYSFTKA